MEHARPAETDTYRRTRHCIQSHLARSRQGPVASRKERKRDDVTNTCGVDGGPANQPQRSPGAAITYGSEVQESHGARYMSNLVTKERQLSREMVASHLERPTVRRMGQEEDLHRRAHSAPDFARSSTAARRAAGAAARGAAGRTAE